MNSSLPIIDVNHEQQEKTIFDTKDQKFTLLDRSSFAVANHAIEHYDAGGYDQFTRYLTPLPRELQATITTIIICQLKRTDIFATQILLPFSAAYQEYSSSTQETEQQKLQAVKFFNEFNSDEKIDLLSHIALSINNLHTSDTLINFEQEKQFFMLIDMILQANKDDKDLLSSFFWIILTLNEQSPGRFFEKILSSINAVLDPMFKQWDQDQSCSELASSEIFKKLSLLFLELLRNREYQTIIDTFDTYDKHIQNDFFTYLLCDYGCQNISNAHDVCSLGFFLMEPQAWQESSELAGCSDTFLLKALYALLRLYGIFERIYPNVVCLFTTSTRSFVLASIEKNERAYVLWRLGDFIDTIALKIIQAKLENFDSSAIKKILEIVPKFNITSLYADLFRRTSKLFGCCPKKQRKYLEAVFDAFLPSLTDYSLGDKNKQAEIIYHECANFYFESDIQEPLTCIFSRHLNYDNAEKTQEMLDLLVKLYQEDINRLKYKKPIVI